MDDEFSDLMGKFFALMLLNAMSGKVEAMMERDKGITMTLFDVKAMMERDKGITISLGKDNPMTLFDFVNTAYGNGLVPPLAIEVVRQLEVGQTTVLAEMGDIEVTRLS